MKQDQFLHVLDRDEAERRFQAALAPLEPLGVDVVPIGGALGRVLAEDVASPVSVPGFDRSNVDGWAVRAADTFGATEHTPRRLRVSADAVEMGRVPTGSVEPGTAMAIPTGGVVPRGADAIVMVEHSRVEAGEVVIVKAVTPCSGRARRARRARPVSWPRWASPASRSSGSPSWRCSRRGTRSCRPARRSPPGRSSTPTP